jgi:hypothetical protein
MEKVVTLEEVGKGEVFDFLAWPWLVMSSNYDMIVRKHGLRPVQGLEQHMQHALFVRKAAQATVRLGGIGLPAGW